MLSPIMLTNTVNNTAAKAPLDGAIARALVAKTLPGNLIQGPEGFEVIEERRFSAARLVFLRWRK